MRFRFILQSRDDITKQLKVKQKTAEEKIKELEVAAFVTRTHASTRIGHRSLPLPHLATALEEYSPRFSAAYSQARHLFETLSRVLWLPAEEGVPGTQRQGGGGQHSGDAAVQESSVMSRRRFFVVFFRFIKALCVTTRAIGH